MNSEDTLIKRQVHLHWVLNEPTSFDSRCLSWGISGLKTAKRSNKWQIAFPYPSRYIVGTDTSVVHLIFFSNSIWSKHVLHSATLNIQCILLYHRITRSNHGYKWYILFCTLWSKRPVIQQLWNDLATRDTKKCLYFIDLFIYHSYH
jgi:hypothetical protein